MAKKYRLVPSKVFLKDLSKFPNSEKPKLEKALIELKKNPHFGRNIKKLASVEVGEWRLRVGDYRVRYDILENDIQLHIIRHRKEVYRKK